jgi:hypothetical protein
LTLRSPGDKSPHSFEPIHPAEIRTAAPVVAQLTSRITMPDHEQISLLVLKSQTAHSAQAEMSGQDE